VINTTASPAPSAPVYVTSVPLAAPDTSSQSSLTRAIELGFRAYRELRAHGIDDLQSHRRSKAQSLRKLARTWGVPLSTLCRALSVYLLWQRNPEIAGYEHVGVCHVSVVLALEGEQQLGLLRKAEAARWSRGQLQRAVRVHVSAVSQRATRATPPGTPRPIAL
jgi:hypothetical protein